MSEKTEKKRLAILRILQEAGKPIGSIKIMESLRAMGMEFSERTVRHYLLGMDKKGLTENLGKRGRQITETGLKELNTARIIDKVGFLSAKIDQITYRMNFDLNKVNGTVVVNISIISIDQVSKCMPLIARVYKAGYSMGNLIGLFKPGEKVGDYVIEENMVGIGTVCSITLNGVLLAHGIPTKSRFGGLLELRNRKPTRFAEIITYEGTSLDPLEVFIRSGMTDYLGATSTGNGRIGVGFREIPMDSRDYVIELAKKLEKVGLGGFLTIGWPSQPLLEIPVSTGSVGVIVIGGLNPAAILEESNIKIKSRALAGLVEYDRLFPYTELNNKIKTELLS
jgi:repressor of nif and glnA expression